MTGARNVDTGVAHRGRSLSRAIGIILVAYPASVIVLAGMTVYMPFGDNDDFLVPSMLNQFIVAAFVFTFALLDRQWVAWLIVGGATMAHLLIVASRLAGAF